MNSVGPHLACIMGLVVLAAGIGAHAAEYPVKPTRLIVPFSPGGSNDIMARIAAQNFTAGLGQQVIVDNRPGASGIVGTELAAKAPPDGYTLLMMSLTFTVNPSLYRKLPYDTLKDFIPVSLIASAPLMLVVNPALPVKSVKELIDYAKANPGKLNFGSGGRGTTPHLAGEMLKAMAGLQMTHVPYKGGGPALADLVGGQIQLMLENIPSTLPFVKAGKLRALAVSGKKRSPLVPD
ncbi:MAG: tripartite tricarboxylate transporter substrate binding protein, partial [Burkholderiales bacterium]